MAYLHILVFLAKFCRNFVVYVIVTEAGVSPRLIVRSGFCGHLALPRITP